MKKNKCKTCGNKKYIPNPRRHDIGTHRTSIPCPDCTTQQPLVMHRNGSQLIDNEWYAMIKEKELSMVEVKLKEQAEEIEKLNNIIQSDEETVSDLDSVIQTMKNELIFNINKVDTLSSLLTKCTESLQFIYDECDWADVSNGDERVGKFILKTMSEIEETLKYKGSEL